MDFKKIKAPTTTITYDLDKLEQGTNNVYESIVIMGRRSDQIAVEMKEELSKKLEEFASYNTDNLEEVFENREQIEISRFYERLPKPTAIAIQEFIEGRLKWRKPRRSQRRRS